MDLHPNNTIPPLLSHASSLITSMDGHERPLRAKRSQALSCFSMCVMGYEVKPLARGRYGIERASHGVVSCEVIMGYCVIWFSSFRN